MLATLEAKTLTLVLEEDESLQKVVDRAIQHGVRVLGQLEGASQNAIILDRKARTLEASKIDVHDFKVNFLYSVITTWSKVDDFICQAFEKSGKYGFLLKHVSHDFLHALRGALVGKRQRKVMSFSPTDHDQRVYELLRAWIDLTGCIVENDMVTQAARHFKVGRFIQRQKTLSEEQKAHVLDKYSKLSKDNVGIGTLIFSNKTTDCLMASDHTDGWNSCQAWRHEHEAANQMYLLDGRHYLATIENAAGKKIWRAWITMGTHTYLGQTEECYLMGRQYPENKFYAPKIMQLFEEHIAHTGGKVIPYQNGANATIKIRHSFSSKGGILPYYDINTCQCHLLAPHAQHGGMVSVDLLGVKGAPLHILCRKCLTWVSVAERMFNADAYCLDCKPHTAECHGCGCGKDVREMHLHRDAWYCDKCIVAKKPLRAPAVPPPAPEAFIGLLGDDLQNPQQEYVVYNAPNDAAYEAPLQRREIRRHV